MNNYQTPSILKQARESLGLSQTSVSRETGVNRSYLSRFESGVQILSDENLQSLQDHYATMGFDFSTVAETADLAPSEKEFNEDGNPTIFRERCAIVDGFVIPEGIHCSEVEFLLDELAQHEEIIEAGLNEAPKMGLLFLDEPHLMGKLLKIGLHGLRCYSIVQSLKGKESVYSDLPVDFSINFSEKKERLGDYLTAEREHA